MLYLIVGDSAFEIYREIWSIEICSLIDKVVKAWSVAVEGPGNIPVRSDSCQLRKGVHNKGKRFYGVETGCGDEREVVC